MINKTLLVIALVLAAPFAVAWNYEECEAVEWHHKDCKWRSSAPQEPEQSTGNHRASNTDMSTVTLWVVTEINYNIWNGKQWMVCARSYELKTFPGSGEYRETGVKVKQCLPEVVYKKYPGLVGVMEVYYE